MTEEEVAEAATTAAQEAANTSYVLQSASQHGTDAQSRYYALAHRLFSACYEPRGAWRQMIPPTVMLLTLHMLHSCSNWLHTAARDAHCSCISWQDRRA